MGPEISRDPDEPVGSVLARMRRVKGLTGAELGRLAGISQSKVSRIESGKATPNPDEVARLVEALGGNEQLVQLLRERAETADNRDTDWRPVPLRVASVQEDLGEWEGAAKTLRAFDPTLIPGLLQTSEYARAIMATVQSLILTDSVDNMESAVLEAVSARMRRQEVLSLPAGSFRFVMSEAVLANRVCSAVDMIGQIARLQEIRDRYENVVIRIVPEGVTPAIPPIHGFELFDDALVVVDTFNAALTSRGKLDTRLYRRVYDAFEAQSTAEIGPILDKYYQHYAKLIVAGG
jgi:transcriptional regulator with XRE-family HTH domain